MGKTYELRKELTRMFETLIQEVHYEDLDESIGYPYLSYEIDEIRHEDNKSWINLEVNIFHYGTSTEELESIADNIQSSLDKYYFINKKIQFSVYKLKRNSVREKDKEIKRRRLTFEIQLHELKEE